MFIVSRSSYQTSVLKIFSNNVVLSEASAAFNGFTTNFVTGSTETHGS
jgi:hypothetical protein